MSTLTAVLIGGLVAAVTFTVAILALGPDSALERLEARRIERSRRRRLANGRDDD